MNEQFDRGEELFVKLSKEKKRRRRKVLITVLIILAVAAIVLVVAVNALRRNVEARFAQSNAEVLSYEVLPGTIHTVVTGSGVLTEEDLEYLTVPAGVEITEVVAEVGDSLSQGDLIARLDMSTVMTALSALQKDMQELDESIADAKGDEVSSSITAGVSGRVKQIFAEKDMDVSACMAQNGALAVLSLDGYMAVDIETDKLTAGDTVEVTLSDGKALEGKVDTVAGGKATVLISDNGPKHGEEVTVETYGTGKLYIHSPLSVIGYAGTVSQVSIHENAQVSSYTVLFRLKNTAFSANYESLLRQRADMEEVLLELVQLYRDSALLAPMDGKISSVDYNETMVVSTMETSVVTMYPGTSMSITISVDETDILSLEEGQKAEVTVSSVSDEEVFIARVDTISKVADTSTGVTRYSAEVVLDMVTGMLAGMTADVDIQIEGAENALIIPLDALHQTRDTHFVYTAYDPETNQYGGRVDVVIGMQNDTQVEILEGLSQGDTVYYTEAPQDIFSFMMSQMTGGGMSGGSGMGGGNSRPSSGQPGGSGQPSGGMPGGMGGR